MRLVVVPEDKERYDQSKFGHNNIEMVVYFLIEESSTLIHSDESSDEGLTYNYLETLVPTSLC